MKTNLLSLYEACQLAFAANDDGIMADALRDFEDELKAEMKIRKEILGEEILGETELSKGGE